MNHLLKLARPVHFAAQQKYETEQQRLEKQHGWVR